MAWIEGLTHSDRILNDLMNIFCTANKDAAGNPDPIKNWQLIYPVPVVTTAPIVDEVLTVDANAVVANTVFLFAHKRISDQDLTIEVDDGAGNFTAVDPSLYVMDYQLGIVTFTVAETHALKASYDYISDDGIQTAVDEITTKAIIKTTTTPVDISDINEYGSSTGEDQATVSMYVEFSMPPVTLNVETGQWTKYKNYYYFECRMFDVLDEATMAPLANVLDENGYVDTYNSHTSEWSRFSWFKDFGEQLKDLYDADPSIGDIEDGLIYDKTPTAGLFGTLGIEFFVSINNDRIAMVLVGDPTVDYDNYLISFGYFGKIDNFEGSVNDTVGNFALTTSSAETPCRIYKRTDFEMAITKPLDLATDINVIVQQPEVDLEPEYGGTVTPHSGSRIHKVSYKFVPWNEQNEGESIDAIEIIAQYTENYGYASEHYLSSGYWNDVSRFNSKATDPSQLKVTFPDMPENISSVKVYAKNIAVWRLDGTSSVGVMDVADTDWVYVEDVDGDTARSVGYTAQTISEYTAIPIPKVTNIDSTKFGVIRDFHYDSITKIIYPDTWGIRTATGVSDVSMFRTRSGAYFQQHYLAFITPEQTMTKDAFNPSRWTGKFHMSPIYIVQGYDGYRGWFKDVVAVDDASIVHLDKLIVNKDSVDPLKPEETYRYFRINANYSCLTNSPNFHYGVAIKEV